MASRLSGALRISEIELASYAPAYPAGHSRRTLLPDLVRSMRPMILELGLSDERELGEVDRAVREHLAEPRTVTMPHLLIAAWAARPPDAEECRTPGLELNSRGLGG